MCDSDCLRCKYPDCISEECPFENLDEYMQFHLDRYLKFPFVAFCLENPWDSYEPVVKVEPVPGIVESLEPELLEWCENHNVMPRVEADVNTLRKAMNGNYRGKKLEKAIYKVRHRENYLASKRRCNARGSGRIPPVEKLGS